MVGVLFSRQLVNSIGYYSGRCGYIIEVVGLQYWLIIEVRWCNRGSNMSWVKAGKCDYSSSNDSSDYRGKQVAIEWVGWRIVCSYYSSELVIVYSSRQQLTVELRGDVPMGWFYT